MQHSTLTDDRVMSLVDQALALPLHERQAFLEGICEGDTGLFRLALQYVRSEEQMAGFLQEPFLEPVPNDLPFEPGQLLIGRFCLVREVDRGGMGIVWEAFDHKLGRRVAIKCAKRGYGQQLPPEVRNASQVGHPNVCKIFEIHTAEGPAGPIDFISMEYVEGETLAQRLSRGPLPKKECLRLALQLCAGLAEAHRNKVIHGDLKSKNVILTNGPDGLLKAVIMDFGLASRLDGTYGAAGEDGPAGTIAYMAPELWKGARPSVATDIYALGVVFWEMVSGCAPSDLGANSSTVAWGERPAWRPPAGYGKWDRIIGCCLKADPHCRYKHVEDVAHALGPSQTKIWLLRAALAAMLAIVASVSAYRVATAPAEKVRLALLPFSYFGRDSPVTATLYQITAQRLKELKSSTKTEVTFLPPDKTLRSKAASAADALKLLGASYVLRATIVEQNGRLTMQAYLTNTATGADEKEWQEEYQPKELRYVPAALAALVTRKFSLPVKSEPVNAAATADYLKGVAALRRESRVDSALTAFERAVAADGDSALPYAGLAQAQWSKYDISSQEVWLNRTKNSVRSARLRNPDVPQVHFIEGLLLANDDRWDQATDEFKRAFELLPTYGDAYRGLGSVYEDNNKAADALNSYRKAVAIEPDRYRNQLSLGYYFYQRGRYEEALAYFRKGEKLASDERSVHYDLGVAQMDLGRFSEAEEHLQRIPQWREDPQVLHTLGLIYLYERRELEAIPLIKEALRQGPERSLWWMNLGIAYRRLNRTSEANGAFLRGVQLAETEMIQHRSEGTPRAHLAYMCSQLGQKSRAYSEIQQALQQSPNDSDVRWMAAVTFEALALREEALSVLDGSPPGVIADVGRWPDLADFSHNSRFSLLLASHPEK